MAFLIFMLTRGN